MRNSWPRAGGRLFPAYGGDPLDIRDAFNSMAVPSLNTGMIHSRVTWVPADVPIYGDDPWAYNASTRDRRVSSLPYGGDPASSADVAVASSFLPCTRG